MPAIEHIKVGVSTWADRSLLDSGFYPKGARSPEARLRYYATRFPLVENDAPYYALPPRHHAELWAERTPPGFTMNVKAFAPLTDHYTDPRRLPADLRDALPADLRDEPRVYPRDLGDVVMREISARFEDALRPLHEAGRLGLVLFQFPVWFPIGRETKRRLSELRSLLPDYRIAVELRNATWMTDRNRDETLGVLRDAGLVYTCVDEPQGFPSSVPPLAEVTSDLALVRMHGRNAARWARSLGSARERFEYLYPDAELREWVPRVQALADRASEVHVVMNNCYSDYAVTNAARMMELLGEAAREQEAARRVAA